MKLAARVENVTKTYDLGPALLQQPLGGAKQDLNFAPSVLGVGATTADEFWSKRSAA